jgi:MFS family permease
MLLGANDSGYPAYPPGIEGAVYGLVMAAIALGGSLTNQFGSWLYDFFGPVNKAHHYSVIHGWNRSLYIGLAFTLAAGFLIPFLPEWTRSREPLQPLARGAAADAADDRSPHHLITSSPHQPRPLLSKSLAACPDLERLLHSLPLYSSRRCSRIPADTNKRGGRHERPMPHDLLAGAGRAIGAGHRRSARPYRLPNGARR